MEVWKKRQTNEGMEEWWESVLVPAQHGVGVSGKQSGVHGEGLAVHQKDHLLPPAQTQGSSLVVVRRGPLWVPLGAEGRERGVNDREGEGLMIGSERECM